MPPINPNELVERLLQDAQTEEDVQEIASSLLKTYMAVRGAAGNYWTRTQAGALIKSSFERAFAAANSRCKELSGYCLPEAMLRPTSPTPHNFRQEAESTLSGLVADSEIEEADDEGSNEVGATLNDDANVAAAVPSNESSPERAPASLQPAVAARPVGKLSTTSESLAGIFKPPPAFASGSRAAARYEQCLLGNLIEAGQTVLPKARPIKKYVRGKAAVDMATTWRSSSDEDDSLEDDTAPKGKGKSRATRRKKTRTSQLELKRQAPSPPPRRSTRKTLARVPRESSSDVESEQQRAEVGARRSNYGSSLTAEPLPKVKDDVCGLRGHAFSMTKGPGWEMYDDEVMML